MIKRSIILLLCLPLLATACAHFKKVSVWPPAVSKVASAPPALMPPSTAAFTSTGALPITAPAPTEVATQSPMANITPDFSTMTFVEKNNLYLQLLSDRQAKGADTTAAEQVYDQSLDATLEGNPALADQYLEQAILLLWK